MSNRDHPSFRQTGKPVIHSERQRRADERQRESARERMARVVRDVMARQRHRKG